MLSFLAKNLREKCLKISTSPILQCRYMSDRAENVILGGFKKPQGGLLEEKYFYKKSNDLIAKIRDHGTKWKSENYNSNWNQFEKVLKATDNRTSLRATCSLNKHKNCLEEAFFLNEQNECYTKLCKKDIFTKAEAIIENASKNINNY